MYDPFAIAPLIDMWLREDIGHADLTAQTMIARDETGRFLMHARHPMVAAGVDIAAMVFRRYDPGLLVEPKVNDGAKLEASAVLLAVTGSARGILTAERTALNIVQRLCAVATETARFVDAVTGTRARIADTRKTTPGLRMLEKHAVSCGGGLNHRLGLDGGVMIKDNHIAVCGGIEAAVRRARGALPILTKLEVECETLAQVQEALAAGVDVIMLDNMTPADMAEAVRRIGGRVPVEASGGIGLPDVRAVAETGVDYISTSKITQAASVVDIGLDQAD